MMKSFNVGQNKQFNKDILVSVTLLLFSLFALFYLTVLYHMLFYFKLYISVICVSFGVGRNFGNYLLIYSIKVGN